MAAEALKNPDIVYSALATYVFPMFSDWCGYGPIADLPPWIFPSHTLSTCCMVGHRLGGGGDGLQDADEEGSYTGRRSNADRYFVIFCSLWARFRTDCDGAWGDGRTSTK